MTIDGRLLQISDGSKFFGLVENMIRENKLTGTAKLKDGTIKRFEYVGMFFVEGKKVHYIKI